MEKYNETYEPEDYVIHDPSRAVAAGDYGLMVAVTGKEQADGYRYEFTSGGVKLDRYTSTSSPS